MITYLGTNQATQLITSPKCYTLTPHTSILHDAGCYYNSSRRFVSEIRSNIIRYNTYCEKLPRFTYRVCFTYQKPNHIYSLEMPTETTSTTAPWFDTNLDERLTQEVISFFSSYCRLEREALYKHLHSVVSEAFSGACDPIYKHEIASARLGYSSLPMCWTMGVLGTQDCRLPRLCDSLAESQRRRPHS